jgi:nucleoside phosphorylase
MDHRTGDPLIKVDVLVVTWTSAEWSALADVLSPGREKAKWQNYGRNWKQFEHHLTDRSPAKQAGYLGEYTYVTIGETLVCLFHSQLHLCTDDATAPVVSLWQQLISESTPSLVITTGTAGGIGAETQLGDVFVVANAKFNCTHTFKDEPWAQRLFSSSASIGLSDSDLATATTLIAPQEERLKDAPTPITRPNTITLWGDVETVDFFGFADTDDSYGIVANDPDAHTEEMDDATLPLALSLAATGAGSGPAWCSIRNASDPQVPSSIGDLEAQSKWASNIYAKYGYWTTVNSAIACWAVIVGATCLASPKATTD